MSYDLGWEVVLQTSRENQIGIHPSDRHTRNLESRILSWRDDLRRNESIESLSQSLKVVDRVGQSTDLGLTPSISFFSTQREVSEES
jgi:hypothetical protein